MADLIAAMTSLFNFLFSMLINFANFFTTNTLGQLLLGCVMFGLVTQLLISIIKHIRG